MDKYIETPLTKEKVKELHAGDYVYITGTVYTARDAAHKRMVEQKEQGMELPFIMKDQIVYYLGPTPNREGQVIGSAGPTTSSRMDKYAPTLLDEGLTGMIGKGKRSEAVIDSMKKNTAVYFAAVGGAGALLSKCIKKSEVIAYDDLGTEAIRKLYVENLPVITVIDCDGNNQSFFLNRNFHTDNHRTVHCCIFRHIFRTIAGISINRHNRTIYPAKSLRQTN